MSSLVPCDGGGRPFLPVLIFLTLLASGCTWNHVAVPAQAAGTAEPPENVGLSAQSPYRDLSTLPPGAILHVPTGREVTIDQLANVLTDARVVFVGEMHTNLEDHAVQLRIIKELYERNPGKLMVGMEMFQAPSQEDLGRWIAGELSDDDFLRVWYRNWSEDFAYYRDILFYLREHHIPLVALNASREEVRKVSKGETQAPASPAGEAWTEEDPYHRAYLKAVFGGHGHGMAENYYAVQVTWEETMAARIHQALVSPEGQGRKMVVLAGAGHIQNGFGIPRRLFGQYPVSYATVVPMVVELPKERPDLTMDVDVPEFPLPLADFVWSVPYRDLTNDQIRLGVQLSHREGGMWVEAVSEGSAAEAAGVHVGDRLVSLDGRDLRDLVDVRVVLSQVSEGDTGTLVVEREGKPLSLSVTYRPLRPHPGKPIEK